MILTGFVSWDLESPCSFDHFAVATEAGVQLGNKGKVDRRKSEIRYKYDVNLSYNLVRRRRSSEHKTAGFRWGASKQKVNHTRCAPFVPRSLFDIFCKGSLTVNFAYYYVIRFTHI